MNLTYYGHACFAVEVAGKRILFDPFISPNPLGKEIDVKKIEADFILVSHGMAITLPMLSTSRNARKRW